MYYIQDYRKRAINTIIPYLIEFPQIVSIIEQSADRYQAIEDVIWRIANNFRIDDARGVFLQALAHNEVTNIIYTDVANDAFTYGTDKPEYQAYGTGHYYSQSSYISGIKKDVTEEKTIRAVKAKIIQNNTNGTIEDLIESLKLYYNAEHVRIFESNPLNISLMLEGAQLEVSSSGNRDIIKNMLPACVALKDLYLDRYTFDVFKYGLPAYGDSRYPIKIGSTTDIYNYISNSVNLDSEFKEYIKTNYTSIEDGQYCCIVGAFTKLNAGATLLSSCDLANGKEISVMLDDNNKISLKYNDTIYPSDITADINKRYTIIAARKADTFNLWISPSVQIYANELNQDISYIKNIISSGTPNVKIESYEDINQPIYLNCKNGENNRIDFGDFTYYAVVFGNTNNNNPNEYYTTCYGEKQLLFNCYENKNHLGIHTNNPLVSNLLVRQSYYNYKDNHSSGRYMYLDGKSGINYVLSNTNIPCTISSIDITLDICTPINISTGNILTDFVSGGAEKSKIYLNETGIMVVEIPIIKTTINEDDTITETEEIFVCDSGEVHILPDEYATFKIRITNASVDIYKNGVLAKSSPVNGTIEDIPDILRVGYDKSITNPFKGFIKNLGVNIIGIDSDDVKHSVNLKLTYDKSLQDDNKTYEYTNYGARFITVPQLISDTTKLDLYGNTLISKR